MTSTRMWDRHKGRHIVVVDAVGDEGAAVSDRSVSILTMATRSTKDVLLVSINRTPSISRRQHFPKPHFLQHQSFTRHLHRSRSRGSITSNHSKCGTLSPRSNNRFMMDMCRLPKLPSSSFKDLLR